MICPKCGIQNIDGSKFCIKCGYPIGAIQVQTNQQVNQQPIGSQQVNQQPIGSQQVNGNVNMVGYQQTVPPQQSSYVYPQQSSVELVEKMAVGQYLGLFFAILLKPFSVVKETLHRFENFQNAAVMAILVSVIATMVNLVKTILQAVRVVSYYSEEVKWVWENAKEINYIQVIGKNFLLYLGIIAIITLVYYIGSSFFKKQANFSKMLGIATLSVVPVIVFSLILSPILGMIYAPLEMIVTVLGGVYTFIIIYELMNDEVLLEGDMKFYFNLICLSILAVGAYYLYLRMFMGSVANGLDNILDMF